MTERPEPFRFGGLNRDLFGWFHAPFEMAAPRGMGIVLCNPIGEDAVRAHRAFRHLAERLASKGFAVLRFDFRGTGDSAEDEGDPGRVGAWLEDIGCAVDALRARAGVMRIGLVGLRFGATLAAEVASRMGGLDALVLWHPFPSGAQFATDSIRQHKAYSMLDPRGFAMKGPPGLFPGEEALGFHLTVDMLAELKSIDLAHLKKAPSPRVFLIEPRETPAAMRLANGLRALGANVSVEFHDHKFLAMTPHLSTLPEPELGAIMRWVETLEPGPRGQSVRVERQTDSAEEAVFFAQDGLRFGILHRANEARADLPAIILLNAGTVHRMGPHRLYVRMAREWARLGFHVFRVDISGIGDSPAETGTTENVCYPPRHLVDVASAMDFLRTRLPIERFILAGLCSGADNAFQVALRDERVVGAVMMNPRTFCVHDLETVEKLEQARFVEGALGQKQKWIKLLKGQVNLTWHLRNLGPNLKGLAQRKLSRVLEKIKRHDETVPARLRGMASRGVETLLVVSEHDPGTEYVDVLYPTEMKALEKVSGFRRVDFQGTDHTFTSLYAQKKILETVTEHLARRHLHR
jgi:pimeloyl-ACP methyl ester carboxylesterase